MGKLPYSITQTGNNNNRSITTDDACEHIKFSNVEAANAVANGEQPRRTGSDEVWHLIQANCATEIISSPIDNNQFTANPQDKEPETTGDTAQAQGAITPTSDNSIPPANINQSNNGVITDPSPTAEPTRPPLSNPHPTHGGEQPHQQTNAGDPVDIFSGSFYLQETDLEIPNTLLPLAFTRFYRSGAASFGPLGWNWDHNFNLFLRELNNGDMALWRNLHEEIFKFDGANFEPQRGVFEKLERILALAQVYEIKGEGGVIMRFERPAGWIDGERIPLIWIKDRHGNQLRFSYGTEDKLAEVRDDDDRYFRFDYDQCGLIVSVTDHTGRKFQYYHDEETMQLVCVKSPAISDHPNGITRIYHYEQPWALPELRHNIIRVEDARGNVYLENTYDQDPASWSYARVTEQLYGGFLYQFRYTQLQWVPANAIYINIPAVRVEVMNPDFGLETYTFNYRGDLLDRRYRLSKDNSYRVVVWLYEFDEQGNPSRTTKPDGSDEINTFDFANPDPRMRGKLLRKELTSASGFPAPSRIVWRGRYESTYQQLIEEKNETANTTSYKYDFDTTPAATTNTGKLKKVIQPDATLPDGSIQSSVTLFEHDAKGQTTAIILPDGVRNELEYGIAGNEKSRLTKQVLDVASLSIVQKIKYDGFGFNLETTDGNGIVTKQIFNSLGLLEKSILSPINGINAEYVLHYDSDKKVISSEKPKGNYSDSLLVGNHILDNFERDVLGYPVKYTLSSNTNESRVLRVANDYRGFPLETINPDGSRIRKTYDERGLPLTEEVIGTDGLKITSKKVYDRSGKIIQETNPFGLITKYEYDGFSRITKVFLPNGSEIKNKWLKNDLLESEESIGDDGTGVIRQLSFKSNTYDEKNRKTTETIKSFTNNLAVSTNITTTYFYDTADRVEKIISNRGGVSTIQYDGLGRVTVEMDAMGNEEHYTYDNNGNVIQTDSHHVEPSGVKTIIIKQFAYDSLNRLVKLTEPDGAKVISEYDDRNLLVKQTDYLSIVKETLYNSYNNKIQEINDSGGLNITHRWTVDTMSRITSYIDPTGQASNYSFDSVGRNNKVMYPNGFTSTKIFNNSNQITKEQLGSGVEFEYTYDAANRISKIINTVFPAPLLKVETHDFSFDGLDRLIVAKAGTENIFRNYDSLGRLLAETTLGNTMSCKYNDGTGEVEKIWPDGRIEKLSHNLNGVLTKIEETVNGTLGSGNNLLATFKTSGANIFGEASYTGGTIIKNLYDERKRLTEITAQSAAGINENIKYRYNKAGIKQVEALLGQNPKLSYFDFDNKYRLLNTKDQFITPIPPANTQGQHDVAIHAVRIASAGALHQEKFLYNESDARTKYSETGVPDINYTFSPGHKIQNDGTNVYTYHTDGTLQNDGIFTYEADTLGRIIRIKTGINVITEIKYDAFGRPSIVKETGKPDKSFNYLGGFVEQENENGIASRQISIHPVTGVPIAYHSALGTHYTFFDSRFNLIGLFDDAGRLLETYRYKSFGLPKIFDNTGTPIAASMFGVQPIFGGQRYLVSSGVYLSKRRLMNPVNGVFLSVDPKGYVDSSCLYVYVAQNPIDFIDPDGEFFLLGILAVMAVGAFVSGGINAARQGIAISGRSQIGWEWEQFGYSVGFGVIAAPILVVAPELAVPLAAWGVANGVNAMANGNYGTGAFDIVTSLAPFGFKGPRNATFGQGSRFGQMRGLGETAPWSIRVGRIDLVGRGVSNFRPSPFGRKIGLGFSRGKPGGREGHVAVTLEGEGINTWFVEKNRASFRSMLEPPKFYMKPTENWPGRPFEYDSIRIPRDSVARARAHAEERIAVDLFEGFDSVCKNCSHFASDVLTEGGFRNFGTGRGSGLQSNFRNFGIAIDSAYSAPFYTSGIHPNEKPPSSK